MSTNFGKIENIIEAKFRIVTPMFLGGADQQAEDIRPSSVKGMLRFWWRALNWSRFRSVAGETDDSALKELHDEEARLFGSAANDKTGGQGVFLLSVRHASISLENVKVVPFTGESYLSGLGLKDRNRVVAKKENDFLIALRFRPSANLTKDIESVKEALRLFGLVGGLGSRSRRGFGSVVGLVKDGKEWRLPTEKEVESDCDWLKTKLLGSTTSPYSALDGSTLFYRSNEDFGDVNRAMKNVGELMSRYRTSGTAVIKKQGVVIRTALPGCRIVGNDDVKETELNFYTTDHHHVYDIANNGKVLAPHNVPPQRAIFGLPHPYRFSNEKKVSFDYIPSKEKGRRASPLMIHIIEFANSRGQSQFRPLLLLLQAKFLPENANLNVSVGKNNVGVVPSPTEYTPIKKFLTTKFTHI